MKGIWLLILTAAVFLIGFYDINQTDKTATKSDLEKVRKELTMQIDSVLRNCDSLKNELRAVRANTDTLKVGQTVIFRTMQENRTQEKSLLDLIIGR